MSPFFLVVGARGASPIDLAGNSAPAKRRIDQEAYPRRLPTASLDNVIAVHSQVFSGAGPKGPQAFAELRSLGVRTVISVDGVKPDVETARQYNLRYVHLPHGYDGISPMRTAELAKAICELPGPVYLHCHHGRHRSPAAAGAACVAAGWIDQASAQAVLSLAGTSPQYRGLYEAVAAARPQSANSLRELHIEFRETVDLPRMVEAMVAIDLAYEGLQQISDAHWQAPANHPDLDPNHQALMLREQLAELMRGPEARAESAEFQRMLEASAEAAAGIEVELSAAGKPLSEEVRVELNGRLQRLSQSCVDCHRKFRDHKEPVE